VLVYNLFIVLYAIAIRAAALFLPKAKAWLQGRRGWASRLANDLSDNNAPVIWMHCASAGEFEQGKPVLEALKSAYPGHRILVSFFSPSGYEVGKKYGKADWVTYLPLDTKANARRFLSIVDPALVVFVKYDYWYHHLRAIADRKIPLLLVSAIFRPGQAFFRWYGGFYRRLLHLFSWLFVQDAASFELLKGIGVSHCSVNGDTRFDRVAHITHNPRPLPLIEAFVQGDASVLVAGSTWKDDEELLAGLEPAIRFIIAPHEISGDNVQRLRQLFAGESLTYTDLERRGSCPPGVRVLIIDNIGMLSRLYAYGRLTYIGGGFNKSGIHNTLEAAAWGKPVFFGPNYRKFREAIGLLDAGAAVSVRQPQELQQQVDRLLGDPQHLSAMSEAASAYVRANLGASERIVAFVQEKRLLTR